MKNVLAIFIGSLLLLFCNCKNTANKASSAGVTNSSTQPRDRSTWLTDSTKPDPVAAEEVSEECKKCGNCELPECVAEIVKHHSLEAKEFFELTIAYYKDQNIDVLHIPDPKIMTRSEVEGYVAVSCKTKCIIFNLNEGNLTTHDNMTLGNYNACPPDQPYDKYYSIALFRGILDLTPNPTRFEFVRLYDKNVKRGSLGIIAYHNATPVYYGDLSSDFPIIVASK